MFLIYLRKISPDLRIRLRQTIERGFLYCKPKVMLDVNLNFNLKIPLRKKNSFGIIYHYTCSTVTARLLLTVEKPSITSTPRVAEHMGMYNLIGKHLENVKEFATSDLPLGCNCTIHFDDVNIIATDSKKFKLLLRESLLLKRDKTILNRIVKSFSIGKLWLRCQLYFQYHMIVRVPFNI